MTLSMDHAHGPPPGCRLLVPQKSPQFLLRLGDAASMQVQFTLYCNLSVPEFAQHRFLNSVSDKSLFRIGFRFAIAGRSPDVSSRGLRDRPLSKIVWGKWLYAFHGVGKDLRIVVLLVARFQWISCTIARRTSQANAG